MSNGSWNYATSFPQTPSRTRSEELRYALEYTHSRAKGRTADIYQPGDIAVCRASLVRIFYDYLERQGYTLSSMDFGANLNVKVGERPARYCVVNRHLSGSQYEVYILTTFRHAQHVGDIPWMGQFFSIPMGATRPLNNVLPIVSYPQHLGEKSPSFLFAIPTRQTLLRTKVRYRVPHSELQRIAEHTRYLAMELPKHQRLLRNSVKDMYWGEAKWGGDDLALAPPADMERDPEESPNDGVFVRPYVSQMRSPVFKLGPRKHYATNELSWVLRNTQQDLVDGSSNYLTQTGLTRSRHVSLKPPYYAPSLRLSSARIRQLIW